LVDILKKRVEELEEMQKDRIRLSLPVQEIITPGFSRVTPTGIESEAERIEQICPDCISLNKILPGVKNYTCEICGKEQVVTG